MNKQEVIGNTTTIGKFLLITFAGWVISTAAAHGLKLPVDVATLAQILGIIAGFAYSYLDAKYPNTFDWLGNALNKIVADETVEDEVLNLEYTAPYEEAEDDK